MVDPVPRVILLAHPFYEHSQTMSATGSLFINNGLGKFPNDLRVPIRLTRLTLADMVASSRLPARISMCALKAHFGRKRVEPQVSVVILDHGENRIAWKAIATIQHTPDLAVPAKQALVR